MDAKEASIYQAIIFLGLIVLFLNLVFIFSSMWLQRKFRLKHKERNEAEVSSMETERMRIAADLHDDAGPLIYSLQRKLEDLSEGAKYDYATIEVCRTEIQQLGGKLRDISRRLVPLSLERKGLLYAVEELIVETCSNYDIKIDFRRDEIPPFDKITETHIFRILQEIIHNTIKHSSAKRLVIEMSSRGLYFVIRTADNGKGFDLQYMQDDLLKSGIKNIKARVDFLNGSYHLDSSKGCSWEIKFKTGG